MKTALRPSPHDPDGPQGSGKQGLNFRTVETGDVMRIWLEHDPVALAILVLGIAAVELLALSF
jgi:hypothetical protein